MNKTFKFKKSVCINCDIYKIFDFHLNTNNLPIVSPPFPFVENIEISDIPLKLNSKVKLTLNFFLFKSEWQLKVAELVSPNLIADLQLKGLFKYYIHRHKFSGVKEGVIMTDEIEFTPPFGFAGLIGLPFIYIQFLIMFMIRHRKTKRYFEKN